MQTDTRPLSPHLQIYRPQWTSVLSILHRLTGMLLSAGMMLITVWLVALASGPEHYASTQQALAHPILLAILVVWTSALFYHLLNGIRHLIWDAGMMMELPAARRSAWLVIALTIGLTALVWGRLL